MIFATGAIVVRGSRYSERRKETPGVRREGWRRRGGVGEGKRRIAGEEIEFRLFRVANGWVPRAGTTFVFNRLLMAFVGNDRIRDLSSFEEGR